MVMSYRLVGSIIDIDGPRVWFAREYEPGKELRWFQAYVGMKTYLGMAFRADPATTCTLEFIVGGRAVVGRGQTVVIVTPKETTLLDDGLNPATRFLNKFDKQDKQFQIQTAGGVIGIEG